MHEPIRRVLAASLVLLGLDLVACQATGPVRIGTTTQAEIGDDGDYASHQGVPLEGSVFEGNRVAFSFSSAQDARGRGYDSVWIGKTTLYARRGDTTLRGEQLVGTTFSGFGSDGPHTVTIQQYNSHCTVRGGDCTQGEYRLTYDRTANDFCTSPAPDNPIRAAVPVDGTWSTTGQHVDNPGWFSFGCFAGAIAKCIDFQYYPWETYQNAAGTIAGNNFSVNGKDMHQTCTRTVRADYCADGTSHTLNGTSIHFYSVFNHSLGLVGFMPLPTTWINPDHPGESRYNMYHEAVWRPGSDEQSAAFCLSKRRWSTISFGGACDNPMRLPDPRRETGAHFCEDYEEWQLENPVQPTDGAVLFNDSAYNDRGVHHWTDAPAFNRHNTGTQYLDEGVRGANPPPDFVLPTYPADFLGGVFNWNTAYLPANLGALIQLWSYKHLAIPGHYITTTLGPPSPEYGNATIEGFICPLGMSCPPDAPLGVPLCLYSYPSAVPPNTRYLTTTNCIPPLGPPYTFIAMLGNLLH